MLDYRIETFITLCKERNYSKTAQILCITQPAVTQHIQYLERFYDCKLFEYENKQLNLTPQGKLLERMALGLSASTKRVKTLIQEATVQTKLFRFGVSSTACELMMPSVIEELYRVSPHLDLEITVDSSSALINGLKSGSYESILIEGKCSKTELDIFPFATEEYIGISSKKYDNSNLSELLNEVLICREAGSGPFELLESELEVYGYTIADFRNTIQVNNTKLIIDLVKRGVGAGFVLKKAVLKELEAGQLYQIPRENSIMQEFNFVMLKNMMFSQNYEEFYAFAKEVYTTGKYKEKSHNHPSNGWLVLRLQASITRPASKGAGFHFVQATMLLTRCNP